MAFKLTPARDWVSQINEMMDDYNSFSDGWNGKSDNDNPRWSNKAYDQSGFLGLNGTTINSIGIQQYKINGQPFNFLIFQINIQTLKNVTSADLIQLPFKYNLIIGTLVDAVGSTGYLRLQGSGSDRLGFANDSGVDISGDVRGSCIII